MMSASPKPTDLYGFLDLIRARPGLYLGEPSITALSHFLHGFEFAGSIFGKVFMKEEVPPFRHFTEWLGRAFRRNGGGASYKRILLSEALFVDWNIEKAAFDMFFDLLDEFRKREKYERASIEFETLQTSKFCSAINSDGNEPVELPLQTIKLRVIEYKYELDREGLFPYRYARFKPRPEFYLAYEYEDQWGRKQNHEQHSESLKEALQRGADEFAFDKDQWEIVVSD